MVEAVIKAIIRLTGQWSRWVCDQSTDGIVLLMILFHASINTTMESIGIFNQPGTNRVLIIY